MEEEFVDKYLVYYRKNMYNNFYISTVICFFLKGIFIVVLNCASSALICPLTLSDTDVKLQMLMENNLNINQPLRWFIRSSHQSGGCRAGQKTKETLLVKEVSAWKRWWSDWFSSQLLGSSTRSALKMLHASPCLKSNTSWSWTL